MQREVKSLQGGNRFYSGKKENIINCFSHDKKGCDQFKT